MSDPELLATSLASAAGFDTDVVLGAVVTLGADAALAAGAALDGVLAGVSVLLDDFAVTGFLLFELAAGAGVLDVDLSDPLLVVADCWGLGVEIPGVEIPGVETPGAIVFDAVALEAFEVEACEVVGLASAALDADLDASDLDGAFFNALAAFLTAFTGAPGADAVDFFEAALLEAVLLEVVLLEAAWFKAALLGATLLDEPCMLTETLLTEALLTEALLTEALLTEALLTEALLTEALLAEALPVEPLLMEALPTCDVALAVLRAMEGAGDLAPAAALDIVCRLAPACGLAFALDALAADAPAPFEMAVFFSADILGTPVSPRCGDGAKAGRKRRPGRTRP